jgi:hypothetical protein
MARLVSAFLVVLLVTAPAGCGRAAAPVEFDFPVGDQCAFQLPRRPDDCVLSPPCMYTDAVVHLKQSDDGEFSVSAWRSEGMIRTRRPEPIPDRPADSPESAALQLPGILQALHVPARPISEICIAMRVDQDVHFGDFIAFYRALENTGVRKVQLVAELVDDPLRFVEIALASEQSRTAFFRQMRQYSEENGFEFSQHPWEVGNRFQIVGDGLAITAEQIEAAATGSAFRVMLELHPQANGTLPTEPMMNHLLSTFTDAVGRTDGAVLTGPYLSSLDE